ncbi:acyl-CoA N-acyltransferase [Pseudovirgaria hyperparasitica]|uniref:Acyl-CoA N-acyltransferase n=1 Tax=Pseudovirgaria hyperparasitica TaxID=470096 RepID=A0A6A6W1T2_9PEZI|nr:acyl-CoA N-acyltransferase [Pseudovirgaria hyperparasitica]KAF2756505.1 acyl-CoA N-acyltransferase [Pseudovirgaria hyperparasitica]
MEALDLFKFGDCNIDPLTETYQTEFYMDYLDRWPECCNVVKTRNGRVAAYLLGKIESSPFLSSPTPYDPDTNTNPNYLPWHAHITALTVASWARGIGLGTKLSEALELVAEAQNCWFIDLFVRTDNEIAIKLYKKLGYTVYKRVVNYYNDGEDAFDMRKPLPRDKDKKHIRENGEDFHVDPSNVW